MNPIIYDKYNNYDPESLKDYIIKTCSEHKEKERALAFAFIVFDHENPNIKKVLKDKEYWASLDSLAGKYLTVFYIDSRDDYYKARQKEIYKLDLKAQEKMHSDGFIGFFQPVTIKPTDLDKALVMLKNEFDLNENISTPFVLFFQSDGTNIIDLFSVSLKEDSVEQAFVELKNVLNLAKASLAFVKKENLRNHQELFNLVEGGVKDGLTKQSIKKTLKLEHLLKAISFFFKGS